MKVAPHSPLLRVTGMQPVCQPKSLPPFTSRVSR